MLFCPVFTYQNGAQNLVGFGPGLGCLHESFAQDRTGQGVGDFFWEQGVEKITPWQNAWEPWHENTVAMLGKILDS